jgi:hypothetical protein
VPKTKRRTEVRRWIELEELKLTPSWRSGSWSGAGCSNRGNRQVCR